MKVKRQEITCESDLKRTLDEMYRRAKEGKEPFYDLVELLLNEELMITAIHNIKSNKGSKTVGIDKKDINIYLHMKQEKLFALLKRHINNYNPKPVKRRYIPKNNKPNEKRPLGIPTILDRIIQEMVRIALEPIAEAQFFKHSYGFRTYRSCEHAIARVLDLIRRNKNYWVIEGDIKGFFDNINHNKLIEILWNMGIRDKRFLSIIKKMLKAGVMEDGKFQISEAGTPQGGIISPLLANIYLNNFDWMVARMFEEHPAKYQATIPSTNGYRRLRQRGHQPCYLVRYADDWVILCESKETALRILSKVEKYFRHVLKLELSKEKTLITNIRETPAKFLGFNIIAEKARLKNKIVGKALPNKKNIESKVREISSDIKNLVRCTNDYYIAAEIEVINSKIVGLSNYFKFGNCKRLFSSLDNRLTSRTYQTFCKIYGKKNWDNHRIEAHKLDNRRERHKGRNCKVYFVKVNEVNIGLTRMDFTNSVLAMNFNQDLIPYTLNGRLLYAKKHGRKSKLSRPTLYNPESLKMVAVRQIKPNGNKSVLYNFEYMMNREYAFNRDLGACKACKINLTVANYHCHHNRPFLSLDKINKVNNLSSICHDCHKFIHGTGTVNDSKRMAKINKYRKMLTENKS